MLNMTSQRWLTREDFVSDVDRSLWWHYIAVITPNVSECMHVGIRIS